MTTYCCPSFEMSCQNGTGRGGYGAWITKREWTESGEYEGPHDTGYDPEDEYSARLALVFCPFCGTVLES